MFACWNSKCSRHGTPTGCVFCSSAAQAGASLIALDLRWYSEAVRLADSFRSELEIAVMSPSLSRREGGVIGNMGPEMMRIYDHIMTGCGRQSDD